MIEALIRIGAVLAVVAAAVPGWVFWRLWRRERQALRAAERRLAAVLATSPAPACGWPAGAGGTGGAPGIVAADFAPMLGLVRLQRAAEVAAALAPSDAAAFEGAFGDLRRLGRGFRLEVTTADGVRRLVVWGRRHNGWDLLWLEDAGDRAAERARGAAVLAALAASEERRDVLQAVLDALPVPVWVRGEALAPVWCNRAYAAALDSTPDAAIRGRQELGAGLALAKKARAAAAARSERRRVVIAQDRHLLEVTECPATEAGRGRPGLTVPPLGFALDRTVEEALRADLARHVAAHAAVLEQMGSAIAIYGADRRLTFYNQAYVRLWGLDEAWLAGHPSFGEVLEELRTRRRLPEYANFPQWKKENLALFTGLIEPREDLMHLPDGTTLRVLIVPHSFGGLMVVMEDVTNTLALESSYNILMAVQAETLDNLAEGVAVFGGDGRLKLFNPAYCAIWGVSAADLAGEPHISAMLDKVRALLDHGEDWAELKDQMVGATLERVSRGGRLERTDGSVLDFSNVPLPDGAVLTTYLDVTDSVRVEQALRARNAALAEADRLKTEFLANVSYQLRTPLNSIMGFAEILERQYFGELNPRQLDYALTVRAAGESLLSMIDDIIDLATIEAGYMVLERRPVEVRALLAGVVGLAQEWTAKKSMRLEMECSDDTGSIDGDEKRLRQALFNLISNAIRSSHAGGTITVSARRDGDSVVLTVRDAFAFVDLAANQTEPAGRPLRQFEPPRLFGGRTREDDAGLGLNLVKSFIELHGGRIGVDSAIGHGTSIHCVLPAVIQSTPADFALDPQKTCKEGLSKPNPLC